MEKQETLTVISRLRRLQDMDVAIMRLQAELHAVPLRKQEIESALSGSRQAVEKAREDSQGRQSALRQNELEIESLRQQIAKLRTQQFQIKSNQEYRALNNEIEHLEQRISAGEDAALGIMEDMDAAREAVAQREKDLAGEQSRVDAETSRLDVRCVELAGDLEKIQAQRAQAAAEVDEHWLQAYNRIMENRRDHALVPLENATCGGCHMKLPPQVVNDVRRAESIIACDFCGRMLFEARMMDAS